MRLVFHSELSINHLEKFILNYFMSQVGMIDIF